MKPRTFLPSLLMLALLAALPFPGGWLIAQAQEGPGHNPSAPQDFNRQSCADLAVSAPGESRPASESNPAIDKYGVVHVLFGSQDYTGLTGAGSQYFYQGAPMAVGTITETRETGDGFGTVLAYGDFNHDFFHDLVVGIPEEDRSSLFDSGAVQVLYGSYVGFNLGYNQYFDQDSAGLGGAAEANDRFGSALAAGDFNHDLITDLAIGVPGEALGSLKAAGLVTILYGSPMSGLSTIDSQNFSQETEAITGTAEANDLFGSALAAGDFNKDGFADLAIGAPGEAVSAGNAAGMIHILYGSADGLSGLNSQLFTQDSDGIPGTAEAGDMFGSYLSAADYNGDGYSDLAVSAHLEGNGVDDDAGYLTFLFGSPAGLTGAGAKSFWQGNLCDATEARDWFGAITTPGDFNADGYADLAISATGEDIEGMENSGMVHILFGSSDGPTAAGALCIDQTKISALTNQANDYFGGALAASDFNCDGKDDLIIGVANKDMGDNKDDGLVVQILSTPTSLDIAGARYWHQSYTGIDDVRESGDQFGFALAAAPIFKNAHWIYLPVIHK